MKHPCPIAACENGLIFGLDDPCDECLGEGTIECECPPFNCTCLEQMEHGEPVYVRAER